MGENIREEEVTYLSNTLQVTSKYRSKSKFPLWENLQVGDRLEVNLPICNITGASNGNYAPEIICTNLRTKEVHCTTFNYVEKYLKNFDYIDVNKSLTNKDSTKVAQ